MKLFSGTRLELTAFALAVSALLLLAAPGRCSVPASDNEGAATDFVLNSLTPAERAWLKSHPVISVVQDTGWAPLEYLDERGEQAGISADYLALVEERLGLKFKRVSGLNWQAAYARLRHRAIDMTTSVALTPERSGFWAFTEPYIKIPVVIVTKLEIPYIDSLEKLRKKPVAVVKGYAYGEWLKRDFPEMDLRYYNTTREGLEALRRGEAFALIENMLVAGYYISRLGAAGLKISGQTPYVNEQCMAVRKDWPVLAGILQKALASITQAERAAIYNRWVPASFEYRPDYTHLWQMAAAAAVALSLLIFWALRLSREVRFRKQAQEELKAGLAKVESSRRALLSVIEDQKLTGEALRASEAKHRAIFENMTSACCLDEIIYKDGKAVDYKILEVNPAYELITGIPRGKAIGSLASELYGQGQIPFLEIYAKVTETGEPAAFEAYFEPLKKYLSITAGRPGPGRFSTVFSDITERKLGEAERERLMKAIEQAGEMIVITDPEGNIQYVNPAFEKVTGYSRAEVQGKNPRLLKSGRQDEVFYREMWASLSSGKPWECRMVNKRKGGTFFTEDSAIYPVVDKEGKIVNYVAVKRDISEQLRLESQFLQSQKMEAVGILAGGIAHDFNNILTAIKAYSHFIHKALPEGSPMRADAKDILDAADRAASLTRQLLAFSRRQVLEPRLVDLNTVVGDMSKMLQRLIGEDVKFSVSASASECLVKVDPSQMEQVLLNLAVNARDALPNGGAIELSTGIVNAHDEICAVHPELPRGPLVCLTLKDNGAGMTDEVKAHAFEPFFTTKKTGKGTGLGLSTVFGIVKQSGGAIDLRSEPGQGTAFSIYLPLAGKAAAAPGPASRKPAQGGNSETVLLVEDDEMLRRLGERVLGEGGYKVLSAPDGASALSALERHGKPVDLLMTDVVMPGLSGRELAREITGRKMAARVLYMSGYTDDAMVRHGVLEPGIALIYKPFTVDTLALKVREVLDGPPESARA